MSGISRPRGILLAAVLMIAFGLAEVATGVTHNFLGIVDAGDTSSAAYPEMIIGALYAASGALVLSLKKWAAALAILFLGADVIGRILLITTGFYPASSFIQIGSFIVGTVIVVLFAIYIRLKWSIFRN